MTRQTQSLGDIHSVTHSVRQTVGVPWNWGGESSDDGSANFFFFGSGLLEVSRFLDLLHKGGESLAGSGLFADTNLESLISKHT